MTIYCIRSGVHFITKEKLYERYNSRLPLPLCSSFVRFRAQISRRVGQSGQHSARAVGELRSQRTGRRLCEKRRYGDLPPRRGDIRDPSRRIHKNRVRETSPLFFCENYALLCFCRLSRLHTDSLYVILSMLPPGSKSVTIRGIARYTRPE